jgi:hypothetical protein
MRSAWHTCGTMSPRITSTFGELRMSLRIIAGFLIVLVLALGLPGCGDNQAITNSSAGPQKAEKVAKSDTATGPLPDGAFKASLTPLDAPATLHPGQKATVRVKVKNISDTPWPAHGRSNDGFFQVNLGNIWLDAKGTKIADNPYLRSGLPNDMKPGEEVEVPLQITAPAKPGDYTLQIDLVQEMVAWFSEKGATVSKLQVKVGN